MAGISHDDGDGCRWVTRCGDRRVGGGGVRASIREIEPVTGRVLIDVRDVRDGARWGPTVRDFKPSFVCEDCNVRIILKQVEAAELMAKEHRDMTDHESYQEPTTHHSMDGIEEDDDG